MSNVKSFLKILELEQLEVNLFRGDSRDIGSLYVFGGQVLGQSLNAAIRTIEDARQVHSLHAYFLLPGDMSVPIIYNVERARDGRSFSTRRVSAIQHGKPIFIMAASFQKEEPGYNHQIDPPRAIPYDQMISMDMVKKKFAEFAPENMKRFMDKDWPIEIRVEPENVPYFSTIREPRRDVWFRAIEALPGDQGLHKCALAYASDFNLLSTALLPHSVAFPDPEIILASLDHAMWFHRPFDIHEWLLYRVESPSASNARGFCTAHIFDKSGHLVASVCQEGLMRPIGSNRDKLLNKNG